MIRGVNVSSNCAKNYNSISVNIAVNDPCCVDCQIVTLQINIPLYRSIDGKVLTRLKVAN